MKKEGFYSSGQFAKKAHVTLRTIRYYDNQDILKPSFVTEYGARFYTDEDFVRLQQILLLKYLGFSLEDIKEMTIEDADYHFLLSSLELQLKLVKAIEDTAEEIRANKSIDWNQMLDLIHLTGMEKSLKNQYKNASNISARINLHSMYSKNKQGWFPWIYEKCNIVDGMNILELGCGSGSLWLENLGKIPGHVNITLSDLSDGMIRDLRRNLENDVGIFSFESFDCHEIPYKDESFDLVIANHVLFYCDDIEKVAKEVYRVLTPGGVFVCSTYGKEHMKEVNKLVYDFDQRIVLAAENLYDRFGRENGIRILSKVFEDVSWQQYEDSLEVTEPEPLISYILSCHGNQNQYIVNRYKEFRTFVKKNTRYGFSITKDAGIFLCVKGEAE